MSKLATIFKASILFSILMFSCGIFSPVSAAPIFSTTRDTKFGFTDNEIEVVTSNGSTVFFGGYFEYAGNEYTSTGFVIDSISGQRLTQFPKFESSTFNWPIITAIASDGAGGWYIGGDFTLINGVSRRHLAHINGDGSLDLTWNPNADNTVYAILVDGSSIYVGGDFTSIGGQTRNRIAKLNNTDGAADASWNPGAGNTVYTLAADSNWLYVGGSFASPSYIGGQIRNRIARVDKSNGVADATWNPNASSTVYAIAISGSDIYAGGIFTSIGGRARNRIAKLDNTTGAADITWNANANDIVYTIQISGSTIYAGGRFSTIGGQSRSRLAALNNTNGQALPWNPVFFDPSVSYYVRSLTLKGSTLYVGGSFSQVDGVQRLNFAAYDTSTGSLLGLNPDPAGMVYAITPNEDGSKVYVGGYYSFAKSTRVFSLGSFDIATGKLNDWHPQVDIVVEEMEIDGDILYIAGSFTQIDGVPRARLAAFDISDNMRLLDWNPGANGDIHGMKIVGNKVYVSGTFTQIGGVTQSYLARIDKNTGVVDSWNPNANGVVYDFFLDGNLLYLGGKISQMNGVSNNHLFVLDTTTDQLVPFSGNVVFSGGYAESEVQALAVDSNWVYVGGYFDSANGDTTKKNLARFDKSGNLDANWTPVPTASGHAPVVYSLKIVDDTLYVGGAFYYISGQKRLGLASIKTTSPTVDLTDWNPVASSDIFKIDVTNNYLFAVGTYTMSSLREGEVNPNVNFYAFSSIGGSSSEPIVTPTSAPTPTTPSTLTTSGSSNETVSPSVCLDSKPNGIPWITKAVAKSESSIRIDFSKAGDPVTHYAIEYGTKSGEYIYGSTYIGDKNTKSYLVEYLKPGTTYYFRIRAGNGCAVGDWSNEVSATTMGIAPIGIGETSVSNLPTPIPTPTPSETLNLPTALPTGNGGKEQPPEETKISNLMVTRITETSALVSWETNHKATTALNFGIAEQELTYGTFSDKLTKTHAVKLENLLPDTNYYFIAESQGNTLAKVSSVFKTKKGDKPNPPKVSPTPTITATPPIETISPPATAEGSLTPTSIPTPTPSPGTLISTPTATPTLVPVEEIISSPSGTVTPTVTPEDSTSQTVNEREETESEGSNEQPQPSPVATVIPAPPRNPIAVKAEEMPIIGGVAIEINNAVGIINDALESDPLTASAGSIISPAVETTSIVAVTGFLAEGLWNAWKFSSASVSQGFFVFFSYIASIFVIPRKKRKKQVISDDTDDISIKIKGKLIRFYWNSYYLLSIFGLIFSVYSYLAHPSTINLLAITFWVLSITANFIDLLKKSFFHEF